MHELGPLSLPPPRQIRAGLSQPGRTADGLRTAYLTLQLDGTSMTSAEELAAYAHLQVLIPPPALPSALMGRTSFLPLPLPLPCSPEPLHDPISPINLLGRLCPHGILALCCT